MYLQKIKKFLINEYFALGNLMNNDLGSYIDPIWKAINSKIVITTQDIVNFRNPMAEVLPVKKDFTESQNIPL